MSRKSPGGGVRGCGTCKGPGVERDLVHLRSSKDRVRLE